MNEIRIAIVVAEYNKDITGPLLEGAVSELSDCGVSVNSDDVVWVPGAVELSVTAQEIAYVGNYDAVITFGAVIKGETDHYEYVSQHVTHGCQQASLATRVPIIFGVLTTDTMQQALERAGIKNNLGWSYALQALEMGSLMKAVS